MKQTHELWNTEFNTAVEQSFVLTLSLTCWTVRGVCFRKSPHSLRLGSFADSTWCPNQFLIALLQNICVLSSWYYPPSLLVPALCSQLCTLLPCRWLPQGFYNIYAGCPESASWKKRDGRTLFFLQKQSPGVIKVFRMSSCALFSLTCRNYC